MGMPGTCARAAVLVVTLTLSAHAFASGVDPQDMPRYCQGEAAREFNERPGDIATLPPERTANGYSVRGHYSADGRRTTPFECRFDSNRRFQSVSRSGGGYGDGYTGPSRQSDYASLAGKDRKDSEKRMDKLGFSKVYDDTDHGRLYTTWWNRSTGECVEMQSKDGRVKSIAPVSRSRCK